MTREEAVEFGNMWLQINEDCKDSSTYAFFQIAIKALEQEPCDDAISRQAVIDGINRYFHDEYYQRTSIQDCRDYLIEDVINELPPVNPQPKTGHWIEEKPNVYKCSECGQVIYSETEKDRREFHAFCGRCGARMDKPQVEGVTPTVVSTGKQEPKTGWWIYGEDNLGTGRDGWYCNQCGHFEFWDYNSDMKSAKLNLPNYCPNCGCRMVEPQESEEV